MDGAPSVTQAAGERPRRLTRPPRGRFVGGGGVLTPYLGVVPFLVYVAIFLVWPTAVVVISAFRDARGKVTLDNVRAATSSVYLATFVRSIELSASTALIGAVCGALLTWAITRRQEGMLRRVVVAACGVLAQFGGVMLTFAFLATFGFTGLVTVFLHDHLGVDVFSSGAWLYELPGLILVYTYFQIPLMVIVFLPAMDGLKPQWQEASETLGGTSWTYWRHVGGPILAPAFIGAVLLLFANAFSAYATAAALISQGSSLVTLQIADLLTSEVNLGQANVGQALALGMVVVVAVVMTLYTLLQRRTSRWLH